MPAFIPVHPPRNPDECAPWLHEAIKRLNRQATSSQQGFAAIIRNETPDSSGNTLVDLSQYFYLPGRNPGQVAYGSIAANGTLTLGSTSSSTKGFIYFGSTAPRIVFDETNCTLGIGINPESAAPQSRLHVEIASPGTTGPNQLSSIYFMKCSTYISAAQRFPMVFALYQQASNVYDVVFGSGGTNPPFTGGSIYFTSSDTSRSDANSTGVRFAYGTFGSDTTRYMHFQAGTYTTTNLTANRNALFCGFNDHCGQQYCFQTTYFDIRAQGDNLSGTGGGHIGGWSAQQVSNPGPCTMGLNSPPGDRTGTSIYDQPVLQVCAQPRDFGDQYSTALRLGVGDNVEVSEGANTKKEVFQIATGGQQWGNPTNKIFAIDRWGRIVFYNPGNGGSNTRLGARRSLLMLDDATTGASAPSVNFEIASVNAWLDGGVAVAAHRIGLAYDDVQVAMALRNVIFCGNTRSNNTDPLLLNRCAFRTSAFYVTDGTFTFNTGDVGAPLGMMNVFNFASNATILNAWKRKNGQTADFLTNFSSDGTTVLTGMDKDGHWYEKFTAPVAGSSAVTGFALTDQNTVVDMESEDVLTIDGNVIYMY